MREILILKPSSLGDIIHGLLVASAIREQCPAVRITWVAREIFAPLVAQSDAVDDVRVFHRRGGVRGFLRLVRELRATRYDAVLDMQGLARTGVLMLATRAHRKWARADAREGAAWLCHRRIPFPAAAGGGVHAVDVLREFLPVLGLQNRLPHGLAFRDATLSGAVPAQIRGPSAILLFPGSRRPQKEWGGFPGLTRALVSSYPDIPLLWLGSEPLPGPFPTHAVPANFTNLTGLTPLAELPAWMSRARLVVANDSGPMHLAAAMSVEVLALFGPTDPRKYGPYPAACATNHVLCAPGGRLQALSVADVLAKTRALLD